MTHRDNVVNKKEEVANPTKVILESDNASLISLLKSDEGTRSTIAVHMFIGKVMRLRTSARVHVLGWGLSRLVKGGR
jgi:hypothetical protein